MNERNSLIDAIRNQNSSILYDSPSIGHMNCYITYAGNEERKVSLSPFNVNEKFTYIHVDYNKITIGPIFQQDHFGCPQCFEERREYNRRYYQGDDEDSVTILDNIDLLPLDMIPELMDTLFQRFKQSESLSYYLLDSNGNTRLLTFLPLHPCLHCQMDKSCQDVNKIEAALKENLYYRPGSDYRLEQNRKVFEKVFDYHNTDSSFFLFQDFNGEALFSVSSYFPINHTDSLIAGTGTGNDFHTSIYTSYFEGLERYAGMQPRGKEQERLFDSFEALSTQKKVLDPSVFLKNVTGKNKDLNLYSPHQKTFWVPSFSVKEKSNVYLPESFAYYKYGQEYDENSFKIYKGNSNGNAVGSHLLDAIYYACLELIERDAFLNHWYLQHTPKRIDISSIEDITITRMVHHLLTLQYDVAIYDITMDFDIPTVWVFCKGRTSDRIATYSTAGAHHNPLKALASAIEEMVHALDFYDVNSKMIKEKALVIKEKGVRELTDHPILYSLETESYLFDFLDGEQREYPLSELYSNERSNHFVNLKQIVQDLLHQLMTRFGDVYIIRQTPKGYEQLQLEVVKVLIPNIQQLWFGEENREISMKRINQAKEFWGYDDVQINEAPHPFP